MCCRHNRLLWKFTHTVPGRSLSKKSDADSTWYVRLSVGLSSVCLLPNISLFTGFIRATNDSNLLSGGWMSKILSDFLWKCFVVKLECFLLVQLHVKSAIFYSAENAHVYEPLTVWLAAVLFLGETFFASSIIGHWQYASNKGMPAV